MSELRCLLQDIAPYKGQAIASVIRWNSMPSIILKMQSCGKENCSCRREGRLHGPYFWLITYRKDETSPKPLKKSTGRKGRYVWKYLGKRVDQVVRTLVQDSVVTTTLGQKSLKLIEMEIEERVNQFFEQDAGMKDQVDKKTRTYPLIDDLDKWLDAKVSNGTS